MVRASWKGDRIDEAEVWVEIDPSFWTMYKYIYIYIHSCRTAYWCAFRKIETRPLVSNVQERATKDELLWCNRTMQSTCMMMYTEFTRSYTDSSGEEIRIIASYYCLTMKCTNKNLFWKSNSKHTVERPRAIHRRCNHPNWSHWSKQIGLQSIVLNTKEPETLNATTVDLLVNKHHPGAISKTKTWFLNYISNEDTLKI